MLETAAYARLVEVNLAKSADQLSANSRHVEATHSGWLAAALDELDYGIVLLKERTHIIHFNEAARSELDGGHPLQRVGDRLQTRLPRDMAPLRDAVADASHRGLRRLLSLGEESKKRSLSVIPLDSAGRACPVLVVLGKRAACELLSVESFARDHDLTRAETRVLVAICTGKAPAAVARDIGVAISTVRTQLLSIRMKTGMASIRALTEQVAALPPLKAVLGRSRATLQRSA